MHYKVLRDMRIPDLAEVAFPQTAIGQDAYLAFTEGHPWQGGPIVLEPCGDGALADWNFVLSTTVPLVSSALAKHIAAVSESRIGRTQVQMPAHPGTWELLTIPIVDCGREARHDLLAALSPAILAGRARGFDILRLPNHTSLIVTERIRDELLKLDVRGAEFRKLETV